MQYLKYLHALKKTCDIATVLASFAREPLRLPLPLISPNIKKHPDMINLDFDNTALVRQKQALEAMLVSNPDTAKAVRKLITQEIGKARAAISQSARGSMHSDPRDAYKAVRRSVYKSILGGQVNILNPNGGASSSGSSYRPQRKLDTNPHQRGGNRRKRSARTDQVDGYVGKDRGFILRFVNSGTVSRQTRYGNRGSIAARNFMASSGQRELEAAAERLGALIDQELVRLMNDKH